MTAWKIYFWIYAILSLIGVIALIPSLPSFNFASWEGTAESILLRTLLPQPLQADKLTLNLHCDPAFFLESII